jgi:hypothetical protein
VKTDENPIATGINDAKKYVASKTLKTLGCRVVPPSMNWKE